MEGGREGGREGRREGREGREGGEGTRSSRNIHSQLFFAGYQKVTSKKKLGVETENGVRYCLLIQFLPL